LKFRQLYQIRIRNSEAEIEIPTTTPKSESNSNLKSKFRCRHRNWDKILSEFRFCQKYKIENETKIEIPIFTSQSKHRNFDEIKIKFRWNLDFVESKKNDFRGNPILALLR
jgi:hypothetical protein